MKKTRREKFVFRGSETRPELPDDLAFDLLGRLSLKKLFQCKCVSKSWCSIICSSSFVAAYHKSNSAGGVVLSLPDEAMAKQCFYYSPLHVRDPEQFSTPLKVPLFSDRGFTQVINGLVCFQSEKRVFIGHVLTSEIMRLQDPPEERDFATTAATTKSSYYFGFDSINRVYKLLRRSLTKGSSGASTNWEILTLRSRDSLWTKLDIGLINGCKDRFRRKLDNWLNNFKTDRQSFLVNGVLYWVLEKTNYEYFLASFDLNEEEFNLVHSPRFEDPLFATLYRLAQFRGCLSMMSWNCSKDLIIHKLDDDKGHSWTKYVITLPSELKYPCSTIVPVGNLPTGEILLMNARSHKIFTLVYSYNHEIDMFERFVVGKVPFLLYLAKFHVEVTVYVEQNIETLDTLIFGDKDIK